MPSRRSVARRVLKTFLPIVLVIFVVTILIGGWLVYGITRPPRAAYRMTPQSFSKLTGPVPKAADVKWKNHDGSDARGWLITGTDGAPAVILLHGYGADRSWLLNLAYKLNETTNFTVLWPDLRGHGQSTTVVGFGGLAAVEKIAMWRAIGRNSCHGESGGYGSVFGGKAFADWFILTE